ncbi:MAG: hypothetical protein ACOYJF_00330 [Prevotella sp.]|jgi:hypothetical protein
MDKEEKYIAEKFGHVNPFRVPDGYFDRLTSDIMKSLPEEDSRRSPVMTVSRSRRWRAVAAAACLVMGLASASLVYHHTSDSQQASQTNTSIATSSYSVVDAMADYTMLDNEDMYAYIAEN